MKEKIFFKTFRENNNTPLDEVLNEFFGKIDAQILHINTVTERVDNIDYLTAVVCYLKKVLK